MNRPAPSTERELFAEALELPADERTAFLAPMYGGDHARRAWMGVPLRARMKTPPALILVVAGIVGAALPKPQRPSPLPGL